MIRDKRIKKMAKDIDEAKKVSSQILINETMKYVKENHRYHSEKDFDKAHRKTFNELEAEYLILKGYCKTSELEREILEKIENNIKFHIGLVDSTIFASEEIMEEKLKCYREILGYLAELKKEYIAEERDEQC